MGLQSDPVNWFKQSHVFKWSMSEIRALIDSSYYNFLRFILIFNFFFFFSFLFFPLVIWYCISDYNSSVDFSSVYVMNDHLMDPTPFGLFSFYFILFFLMLLFPFDDGIWNSLNNNSPRRSGRLSLFYYNGGCAINKHL